MCGESFNYTLFEPALKAIPESRRKFVLAFTFVDWLESHVRKGQGHDNSIFSRLCNISTLIVIDSWSHFPAGMLTTFSN